MNTLLLLTSGATVTGRITRSATAISSSWSTGLRSPSCSASPSLACRDTSTPTRPSASARASILHLLHGDGFHGFHVTVGAIFLAVCLYRALKKQFKPDQHIGLEAAAWYWHFVDVVWLFLFIWVYWWGG